MNPENEPGTVIVPVRLPTLHERVLSLMQVALDLAFQFLHLSSLPGATKILVDQGAKRIGLALEKKIREMPEEEIRKQILYVRDEILPYLLSDGPDKNPRE